MKQLFLKKLSWLMSIALLSPLVSRADTNVPCLKFSGNAETVRNIDLAKLNRITFGDNSMVISPSNSNGGQPVELQYSHYHHLEIGDAVPTVLEAESIILSQTSSSLKVGETLSLTAIVMPETSIGKTVTWASSNESVATVDAEGKVTALSVGDATITATSGSVSASCKVTVVTTPVESVVLSATSWSGKVGETVTLTANVLPENASDKTVTWTSSNESVATVDAEGKVTALSVGKAEITASCGEVSATCVVTVEATFGGINTLDADSNYSIFVDTKSRRLYLKSLPFIEFSIRVFDDRGILLLKDELCDGDSLNLESLVPGVYMAVASNGNIKLNVKFILN